MIGRASRVEAKHVRALTKQRRRVLGITEQRRDHFVVEGAGELETGDETRHPDVTLPPVSQGQSLGHGRSVRVAGL
jgi:hypothetical protein